MTDIIEDHFKERIDTHVCVGNWIADEQWKEADPPYDKPSLRGIKEQLDNAKHFMKMLNKYQRLKK